MTPTDSENRIFSILSHRTHRDMTALLSLLVRPLEHVLGLSECDRIYGDLMNQTDPHLFMRGVLAELNVRPDLAAEDREHIPAKGPAVVVANHPFGGIEGILLADLLLSVRKDVKIMANFLLNRVPQMRALTIPVDPFKRPGSAFANIGPLRDAVCWVRGGGMLLVFPAGEVSHIKLATREITDPSWSPAVGTIVRRAKAAVVPIFFRGRNRAAFQAAGVLHPRLRTALLARELLNKRGTAVQLKIGAAIPYRWLQHYTDDSALVDYLRWRTYILGYTPRPILRLPMLPGSSKEIKLQPLAPPQDPIVLRQEVSRLPAEQLLTRNGPFAVWQATSDQIPHALLEIGRLREVSFRAASEGTGHPLDLDRFDSIYLHVFIWNEAAAEIVGAYRLGPTDRIIERHGKQGLYTSTLFHSRMEFFRKIGPALEMGRSFIRPEYQKSYSSLLLLWKGIGSFVARNPRYRMLFGPVSISRDYSDLSRRLIATTLLQHSQAKDLALMVKPRKPARLEPIRVPGCSRISRNVLFQDFKEVCALIGDIEFQQKDVPVLLRHYLNLGGQLLAFNIDRNFGDVMDGLIVVDLLRTDRKTLRRYMGTDGLAALLAHHDAAVEREAGAVNLQA
jgi:putative hemolysin